jgi:hypothetical protein
MPFSRRGLSPAEPTDSRLIWGDALGIDVAGKISILPQIDRLAAFNGGKDVTEHPFHVYTVESGTKPLRR